jgi:choline dehydrogenase-like flavoprotein
MAERVEHVDVCVVGTGAAGGLLAYRLARARRRVLSLEQGADLRDDYFTNDLAPEQDEHFGISRDQPWPVPPPDGYYHDNVAANRLYARSDTTSTSPTSEAVFKNRQIFRVNGKQNLWGGVSLRLSPRDFRARDHGDGDVNWPLGYDDLAPHYTSVEHLIGVCGTREGLDVLPDGEFLPPMPLRPADELLLAALPRIREAEIRAIPNRKAVETRPEVAHVCPECGSCIYGCKSGSVYKFSSRLLPEIVHRPNYRIRYQSKVVRLRRAADTSAIEAAECLDTASGEAFEVRAGTFVLAAGALETPRILLNSGLANSSGLVGRYLQDNVKVMVAGPLRKLIGKRATYSPGFGDHLLIPRFLFDNHDFRGGYQAQCVHVWPRRPFYLAEMRWLPGWLKDLLARWLYCSYFALLFFGKPEARAENRLVLGERRDVFGVPQVEVEYQWSESERRMQASMVEWGRTILRAASAFTTSAYIDAIPGNSVHYAGTCRMAASMGEGVVDADCRSFDHPNLYLCDGSILPDLSEKNPTLTIMALAERLANHLAGERGG